MPLNSNLAPATVVSTNPGGLILYPTPICGPRPDPKIVITSPGAIGPSSKLALLTKVLMLGCGPSKDHTKVCADPAALAVKVTVTIDETADAVAVNVAVVCPALTVTETGRLMAGLSALNATLTPSPPAGALKVTLQVVVAGGTNAEGSQLNPASTVAAPAANTQAIVSAGRSVKTSVGLLETVSVTKPSVVNR